MSRRIQKQLVEHRLADIRNNKARKGFKWGFSDKTGWDWLDLMAKLAIPLILGIATLLFSIQQAHLADLQHQADQQSALEQERQATLVAYLNNMRDLLLNRGLLISKPNDEIRVVALTETLSAMRQLDGKRNSFLVQFLQDTHLIGYNSGNIVNFGYANLNSTGLTGVGADLSNVDLSGANLSNVDFYLTDLDSANLSNAFLDRANLSGASLINADLAGATLSGADLSNTFLLGADLNQVQLDQVQTCQGAYLPEGLICNHAI